MRNRAVAGFPLVQRFSGPRGARTLVVFADGTEVALMGRIPKREAVKNALLHPDARHLRVSNQNRAGNPARARVRAELFEARDTLRTLRDERRAKRPALRADDAAERRKRIDAAIERLRGQLSEIRATFRRRRAELAVEQRAALVEARARHRLNLTAIRAEIRDRDAQRWAQLLELRRVVAEKRALLASMRSESAMRRGRRAAEPYQEALDVAQNAIEYQRPELVIAWRHFRRSRGASKRLRDWYRAGKERLRKGAPRSAAGETIGVSFIEYADENPDTLAAAYEAEERGALRAERAHYAQQEDDYEAAERYAIQNPGVYDPDARYVDEVPF